MHTACVYGHFDIVKLIYHFKEDINRPVYYYNCESYEIPIFAAIKCGHTEIAKFLADTPRELQKPSINPRGKSTLYCAIQNNNLELVKYLVPRTKDLNKRSRLSWMVNENHHTWMSTDGLIHAAVKSDLEIFKYLIFLPGFNPNVPNGIGMTALHQLCDTEFTLKFRIENIVEKVEILAPLADPKIIGPLHIAAKKGSIEILKILIKYLDANLYINSYYGQPCRFLPIDFAILSNNAEAVEILAPHTKELRVHEIFKHRSRFCEKSMDKLKSMIEERNKMSED